MFVRLEGSVPIFRVFLFSGFIRNTQNANYIYICSVLEIISHGSIVNVLMAIWY